MNPMKRSGVTLTEILVVIGITGILLAILIPAVQHARESARRLSCQNNLRQLAFAVQNHEAAQGVLPDLYFGNFLKQPRSAIDEFHFHSWRTAILPQLEQKALYERINLSLPATVATNQANLITSVSVFVCPSTRIQNAIVPDILEYNNGAIPTKKMGNAARSDY
jgi:prepilin-type N-terminal cleavage/methylation domain-containing protein